MEAWEWNMRVQEWGDQNENMLKWNCKHENENVQLGSGDGDIGMEWEWES